MKAHPWQAYCAALQAVHVMNETPVTLINLPVGSGKSIVLAVSARIIIELTKKNVIIVAATTFGKQYMRALYS